MGKESSSPAQNMGLLWGNKEIPFRRKLQLVIWQIVSYRLEEWIYLTLEVSAEYNKHLKGGATDEYRASHGGNRPLMRRCLTRPEQNPS